MTIEHHDGFRVVRVAGRPYERGAQHGRALRADIQFFRDSLYRDVLFRRGRIIGTAALGIFLALASRMARHIPVELREEMRGVADGAGVRYRDVLLINCFDDILHSLAILAPLLTPWQLLQKVIPPLQRAPAVFGCSSFVVLEPDGLVHGRNLDYMVNSELLDPDNLVTQVLREYVVVLEQHPERGLPFASIAWPGYVGVVTGMNSAGLSLACHTSAAPDETPEGIPLPLLYRLIVQYADGLDEAERRLRAAPRTIGNNLTVASAREGDARAFEVTPHTVAAWGPTDGLVAVTNHFQDPILYQRQFQDGWVISNSLSRLQRLHALCPTAGTALDAAAELLNDLSPCDPDGGPWDCLLNPGTIYSTVFDPQGLRLRLRCNDRPERRFVELDLAASLQSEPATASAA